MTRSTKVTSGPSGALVVKQATGDDVAPLIEEARRLEAAAHPGVVELLSSHETSDGWELRLAHGGRPLPLAGGLPAREVAGLAAGIASTLADLHDTGVVHGRLDASHVLIGDRGRPVLCGLGSEPVAATPADDVAGLGALLVALLGEGVEVEPIPERRWSGRRSWNGWERRCLLLLADQACADPPSRRPTARRLAAAIAEAVPGAGLEASASGPGSASPPTPEVRAKVRPRHGWAAGLADRPRAATLAGALLVVLALGILGIRAGAPPDREPTEVQAAPAVDIATTPATAPRPARRLPTTTTTTTAVPVHNEGATMVVGGRRYQVGQAGDLVVVGDWDCVGGPTPALLRPSTGEVFVFTSWPADGTVTVRPAALVRDGSTPGVEVGPDGCARLVVRHADGTAVPVPVSTGRSA